MSRYIKGELLIAEWIPPIMFSIVVMVAMYAVKLLTTLHYSRTEAYTKLTLYPFYIILAYLFFEGAELLSIMRAV